MAKREQFITSLTRPECERTGFATWEENENPGDLETTLKSVLSDGFRIGPQGEIYCANCGVEAISGKRSD
jgi:hypothetical protein